MMRQIKNKVINFGFKNFKLYSGDICKKCSICSDDYLWQKMIIDLKDDTKRTSRWYQLNAIRTMNVFDNREKMLYNARWGLKGEAGELTDCLKKIVTHNLSEEKIIITKKIIEDEIGDIMWYIAASLSVYFNISMSGMINFLFKENAIQKLVNRINRISNQDERITKDNLTKPYTNVSRSMCLLESEKSVYFIRDVDDLVSTKARSYELYQNWDQIDNIVHSLKKTKSRTKVIKASAKLILELAILSNIFLEKSLDEILLANVERLRERYPIGFDTENANKRIDAAARQKLEEAQAVQFTR